jgi:hypothetical protein
LKGSKHLWKEERKWRKTQPKESKSLKGKEKKNALKKSGKRVRKFTNGMLVSGNCRGLVKKKN